MTTATKQTLVEWVNDKWSTDPQYAAAQAERKAKVEAMVAAGKGDRNGSLGTSTTNVVFVRNWADQAAADEYKTFIEALSAKYSLPLVSITIQDAPANTVIEAAPAVV